MRIIIPGNPIPKARHKMRMNGRFPQAYDPKAADAKRVRECLRKIAANGPNFDLETVIHLDVSFYVYIPISSTKAERTRMAWGLDHPSKKPDIDNLLKFILDCANGILFKDDAQICSVNCVKRYSENPRTEINMTCNPTSTFDPLKRIFSLMTLHEVISLINNSKNLIDSFQASKMEELNFSDEDLRQIAYAISKMADMHSDTLRKISRECPGYWASKPKQSNQGKILC